MTVATGPLAIGRAEDVPLHEGRRLTVGGHGIAVFHTPAGFRAIDADCPHRAGPLEDGLTGDGCVTCPLHNWRIDLATGVVVAGGEGEVAVYPVSERNGWLYLERIE